MHIEYPKYVCHIDIWNITHEPVSHTYTYIHTCKYIYFVYVQSCNPYKEALKLKKGKLYIYIH